DLHVPEAVLLYVVAQPEDQRGIDLFLLALDRLGDPPLELAALRALGPAANRQVAEQQLRLELSRARQRLPVGADNDAGAVEDELVLTPDRIAEREGRTIRARPVGNHPLSRPALAAVVGRGGGVDH